MKHRRHHFMSSGCAMRNAGSQQHTQSGQRQQLMGRKLLQGCRRFLCDTWRGTRAFLRVRSCGDFSWSSTRGSSFESTCRQHTAADGDSVRRSWSVSVAMRPCGLYNAGADYPERRHGASRQLSDVKTADGVRVCAQRARHKEVGA